MRILKYISVLILVLGLSMPSYAVSKDGIHKETRKKTTFSKKGKFKKDDSFNQKDVRGFGPPDPTGGGGGNPVPVDTSLFLLLMSGVSFSYYIYRKRKK